MTKETINAVIRKTKIKADGGNLSVSLYFYFGDNSYKEYCAIPKKIEHFMRQIMRIADAEQWEDLPGKHIRLRILSAGNMSGFSEMGHIVEDDWINVREAVECS
jgi:hypothetical protein